MRTLFREKRIQLKTDFILSTPYSFQAFRLVNILSKRLNINITNYFIYIDSFVVESKRTWLNDNNATLKPDFKVIYLSKKF